jgi:hypothetical protein
MDPATLDRLIAEVRAGAGDPAALARGLADSPLLVALASPPDGAGDGSLWVFPWDGAPHGALFTSREHLEAVPDIPGYAVVTGAQLAGLWPADLRAAINPGAADAALVIDAAAVRSWVSTPERVMPAGTEFAVGAPADPPDPELVASLRSAVAASAGAEAAYVVQFVAQGQAPRIVIGVELRAGASPRDAVIGLADATAADHPQAALLDFVPLEGELLRAVTDAVPAIRP